MNAVVLAAGASSRFWPLNTRHKSLVKLKGKTLLRHTLDSLASHGVGEAVVVQGPDRDVESELDVPEELDVSFVVQEEPRGMGNALEQARERLDGKFIVTGPYRIEAGAIVEKLEEADLGGGAVAAVKTDTPEQYGIIEKEGGRASGLVEKPAPEKAPSRFRVTSTYLLDTAFFTFLNRVEEHEYSFEDALDRYMEEHAVGVAELDGSPPSLKYPWDVLAFAERLLDGQERDIAESADVADSAKIDGNVVIGEDAKVYENAVIRGPCYIGPGCVVGNNSLVRDCTNLEEGSSVGANAEVRGVVAQDGFSMHSGFVGDSVLGRDVSLGAGAVVANRRAREDGERPEISVYVRSEDEKIGTGRDRLGVIVGDEVEIGTQANLMPGICVGEGSFIGPSTMVGQNVGEEKKFYSVQEGRELER